MGKITTASIIREYWRELVMGLRAWSVSWDNYNGEGEKPPNLEEVVSELMKKYKLRKKR